MTYYRHSISCLKDAAPLSDMRMRAGLLLASYWALRYFAPAALSLWAAKRARKHWDFLSATMVMAATYAVSMAASYRIWTGPTSTYKMHYPLFKGKITIPAVVGQWIRHNRGLAKILTKMVSTAHLAMPASPFHIHFISPHRCSQRCLLSLPRIACRALPCHLCQVLLPVLSGQ